MGRVASGPAAKFASAVAAEVRAEIARQQVAISAVELRSGLSHNYLWKRLSDQLPLNLNDLDLLAQALDTHPGVFVTRAEAALTARSADVIEGRFGQARDYPLDAAALDLPTSHLDEDAEHEQEP